SFSTLVQSRTDLYKIYGKGYLIVLRFDSIGELIKAKGSEGALLVLRSFLSGRKEGINGTRLYRFTPGSIGLLVPNCGQSDAISICESIDEWVEKYHQKNPTISLRVTYLPIIFPQGYPAATDFLSHARDRVASISGQTSVNTIYFEEGDYYRVASKKLFRLNAIKEKFTNNTFRVLLQPLLDAKNKQIFGAEMLLRLDDDFRKTQLNTAQLIQVAYENNRIGLISNALLSYRGDLYRQYGNAFFKIMGIRRITLNTSSSFLKDEDLSTKRKNRIASGHVPDNFFAFEVPEKDIYDDYLSRKPFAKKRTSLGVTLICDGFTGEFVSLERLQELGFSEIKIGRDIVGHIDTDRIKYTQLLSFLQDGKEYGLKVGLIGVENREQYRMIKEMGYDCYRQGYAFYPPIEKEDFVKAVRHTNISIVSLAEKE
ncbi:MAG: EAL domain-containing protein, partial [Mollicutes bacterium]|nr:EAL domain-containing protein [Mollicutes bacterium]